MMTVVLKCSRVISGFRVELKITVSEISPVAIVRVDVVNDCMSVIFIPVCEIDVSSYWCTIE
jgi:hypothetical protein